MEREWDDKFDNLIRGVLKGVPVDAGIAPHLDLAAQGVDSMAIVELIVRIEETYEVVFPDEAIGPQSFATPAALWKTIGHLTSPGVRGESR